MTDPNLMGWMDDLVCVAQPREVGRMRWPHDARIVRLQAQLLDHSGHVTRGLGRDDARITLDEINRLRSLNGWQPLDMTGRWRRPKAPTPAGIDPIEGATAPLSAGVGHA